MLLMIHLCISLVTKSQISSYICNWLGKTKIISV